MAGCRVTLEAEDCFYDVPSRHSLFVAHSIRLPVPEVEPRLRTELAIALYAQGILSFGKATELANLSRYAFAELIGDRDIPRHYTADCPTWPKTWPMPAVSNTSPVSNLLLSAAGSPISNPRNCGSPAVATELKAHPDPVALAAIDAAIHDQWMRIAVPLDTPLRRMLRLQVHLGEAETIALVADLKAETVIIDEQEGRALASQAGLLITGTLGILLLAKQRGEIPAVKPEIQALRAKTRFFLSSSLEAAVLSSAGE